MPQTQRSTRPVLAQPASRVTPARIVVCCVAVAVAAGGGWAIAGGSGSDPAPAAAPNGASSQQRFPQREVAVQPSLAAPRKSAAKPAP
jgi:hypothetical protein